MRWLLGALRLDLQNHRSALASQEPIDGNTELRMCPSSWKKGVDVQLPSERYTRLLNSGEGKANNGNLLSQNLDNLILTNFSVKELNGIV